MVRRGLKVAYGEGGFHPDFENDEVMLFANQGRSKATRKMDGEISTLRENDRMRRTLIFFTISILLLFGVSCSGKEKAIKEAEFQKLFPINAMNSKLKFEKSNPNVPILNFADPEEGPMSFGKEVKLMLVNQSEDTIQFLFPENFHSYMYVSEKNTWREIDNTIEYIQPHYKIIFQPNGHGFPLNYMMLIRFEPQRNPHIEGNVIRVVAVGDIMKNGELTGEQTGAYIDLELKP